MSVLESLNNINDIKKLNINELNSLCEDLRSEIVKVVGQNGGHLSANLGTVELIVALVYVFDFNFDKIIFDVGHQAYTYKILTERKSQFDTIRKKDGLSGYPNIFESKFDSFNSGHAGNSISASLGYALARDKLAQDYFIINVVGDGSFFSGTNLEALSSTESKPLKFLTILNDNGMSISKNNNGLYKMVSKITSKKSYSRFMDTMDKFIGKYHIGKGLKKIKRKFKYGINNTSIIDSLGYKYIGVFDGNNLKELIKILTNIKNCPRPTLLHLNTKKGKGYSDAEKFADTYHGIGAKFKVSKHEFSQSLSGILNELIEKDKSIVAITAGMKDGTGLCDLAIKNPNNFIDVGIAEEHAVSLASGMALGGLKPMVCIYSTFLQRGFDQMLMDVCMQELPVTFLMDRSGFVGSDGATHQGLFDTAYLKLMPNLTILCPSSIAELKQSIIYASSHYKPVAIKYNNCEIANIDMTVDNTQITKFLPLSQEKAKVYILAVGNRMLNIAKQIQDQNNKLVVAVNARCLKPLDENYLDNLTDCNIITLEEGVLEGGFYSSVLNYFNNTQRNIKVIGFGSSDKFVAHMTVSEQLEDSNLTFESINEVVKSLL